ncbi:MAG: hypothetical protein LQ343_003238 [Gyalolechia ehrenbergii]|nr:MAG: hypothetical protein LQ343_003238 [Gyalolechia ehrenbergii]
MGLRVLPEPTFLLPNWSCSYTLKARKAGTQKVRNESAKARKDYWQQCVSKVHDVSTGLKKPLTRAAALTQLITTAAQYVNVSYAPFPLVKAIQAPSKPASDGEVLKVIMAQIYGDIDNAWLSGMAGLEAHLANPAGSAAAKGQLESCLTSIIDLEASCVQKVIEYAALWFQDDNLEATTSSVASKLFSPFHCRILRSKITSFQVKMCRRYAAVATGHGWMMLSILAHSEAFRNACRNFDESSWNKLMLSISLNHLSIKLFFKVRGLDWKTPLRQLEQFISPDTLALYLEDLKTGKLPDTCFEKPHSYVVPGEDRILHRPNYLGVPHLDIPTSKYDIQVFRQDPSLRVPNDGTCYGCSRTSCKCEPSTCENVTKPLVELIQCSAQKGIGVRSLQRIKKGDVLDEYVGEFKYASSINDATYALELERPLGDGVRTNNPILIDAQVYGNWTRYINASCEPSLKFMPAIIGNRYRMMVVATRDINIFEELTIDYGDNYWLESDTRMCECNERHCLYADAESKKQIRMITGAYADRMDVDDIHW